MKEINQKQIFLEGEGDQYHLRNQDSGPNAKIQFLSQFLKNDSKVLEIGCGDGRNFGIFTENGAKTIQYTGLDPSAAGVNAASEKFPGGQFVVGTADSLPFEDGSFDLIYFGFCFYLVDRPALSKVVYEADRCLKQGGVLAITDFSPKRSLDVDYHHRPGIKSYKFDYAGLFLSLPYYCEVERRPHFDRNQIPGQRDWVSTMVMYKDYTI